MSRQLDAERMHEGWTVEPSDSVKEPVERSASALVTLLLLLDDSPSSDPIPATRPSFEPRTFGSSARRCRGRPHPEPFDAALVVAVLRSVDRHLGVIGLEKSRIGTPHAVDVALGFGHGVLEHDP